MELTHIELGKLTLSAINMRHGRRPPDVSDILPSVRARGVLVPLLVRPNGADDHFEIVAGRRRYFAAKAVAEQQGEIAPLPCAVMEPGDDAAALEASLLENLARLDPDPMTQYETFVRLAKQDRTVAEIAATFGITEIMVQRRLALGNLLPKIREACRDDEIDDETIRQLTLASKAQQRAWLALFQDPEQYAPRSYQLKQWLFGGQEIATDVALFALDDYQGHVVADLFGERSYFADADQFWTLQNQAVAARRDQLLEAGWCEVTVLEPGQRFHPWEHEKTPKEAGGRVYITVTHGGEVEVHESYLTRKEARRVKAHSKDDRPNVDDQPIRCELSKAMQNYVELHRHAAARVALLRHTAIAFRLMVAHALRGSDLWSVKPEPQDARSADIAESVAASSAQAVFDEERHAVLALLDLSPGDTVVGDFAHAGKTGAVFAKLLDLSDEEVLRVAAYVMAETLAVGTAAIEAVGNHVGIDMAAFWQPDEAFFDLVRGKSVTSAMLAEVAGKAVADQNLIQRGATQKKIIQDSLDGTNGREQVSGWLPGYLAFPFRTYTDQAGGRIEAAWQSVRDCLPTSA